MKKLDAYLHWKQCKGIFSLFGRCTTPSLHLAKIRHPWLAEAPESSIWNNLLWIFHYSNCLERSFGTPNAYNYQKFRSRAHPARMQLYYLPDLRFTLVLLLWHVLFHACWSDYPEIIMHTNSQNLALCRLKFFFSQSKRVQKKKWSREVKHICQQLKLQSTSYSVLVNSLSCICSDTSIV